MGQIDLKPYVKGNSISYSLMSFHVRINIKNDNKILYFQIVVTNSEMEERLFDFKTLEEAIYFIENDIRHLRTFAEVEEAYSKKYEKADSNGETITLSPDEVDQAIIEYFGKDKDYRISVTEELYVDYQRRPNIIFYIIEHISNNNRKVALTKGDLHHALNAYINFYNYELIDFKYKGGVHQPGLYIDEPRPYYEGIELSVVKKKKEEVRKLSKEPKNEKRN